MKNIELKVRVDDFKDVVLILKKIKANYKGKLKQVDTYYKCKKGRLKIREINGELYELIFYQRPDRKGSKVSNYQVISLKSDQCKELKAILKITNSERVVVKKERKYWIYNHTRIHLDSVKGLGYFLELETVQKDISTKTAKQEHDKIKELLGLKKYQNIKTSYSDM